MALSWLRSPPTSHWPPLEILERNRPRSHSPKTCRNGGQRLATTHQREADPRDHSENPLLFRSTVDEVGHIMFIDGATGRVVRGGAPERQRSQGIVYNEMMGWVRENILFSEDGIGGREHGEEKDVFDEDLLKLLDTLMELQYLRM